MLRCRHKTMVDRWHAACLHYPEARPQRAPLDAYAPCRSPKCPEDPVSPFRGLERRLALSEERCIGVPAQAGIGLCVAEPSILSGPS